MTMPKALMRELPPNVTRTKEMNLPRRGEWCVKPVAELCAYGARRAGRVGLKADLQTYFLSSFFSRSPRASWIFGSLRMSSGLGSSTSTLCSSFFGSPAAS